MLLGPISGLDRIDLEHQTFESDKFVCSGTSSTFVIGLFRLWAKRENLDRFLKFLDRPCHLPLLLLPWLGGVDGTDSQVVLAYDRLRLPLRTVVLVQRQQSFRGLQSGEVFVAEG